MFTTDDAKSPVGLGISVSNCKVRSSPTAIAAVSNRYTVKHRNF